jgi:hypothetical protein
MTIPHAIFPGTKNGTHPLRADQTLVQHFGARGCVTPGPASPTTHYHHYRRHSHSPSATLPHTS